MKFTIISVAVALLATVDAQNPSTVTPPPKIDSRICDYQSNGYFFSTLRTHGLDARAYCKSVGSALVDVDNNNFASLTQMIIKCLGPSQKAWINSWDGNTFANSPLAIWTGLQSGSGSVNINIQKEPLFAICFDGGNHVDSASSSDSPNTSAAVGLAFDVDEYALPSAEAFILAEEEVSDIEEADIDFIPAESEMNAFKDMIAENENASMAENAEEYHFDQMLNEDVFANEDADIDFVPAEIDMNSVNDIAEESAADVMLDGNVFASENEFDFVPAEIDMDAAKDIVVEDEIAENAEQPSAEGPAIVENDKQSDFSQMLGFTLPKFDKVNA